MLLVASTPPMGLLSGFHGCFSVFSGIEFVERVFISSVETSGREGRGGEVPPPPPAQVTKCEEHNSIIMPIIMCWSAITPYLEGSRLMTRAPPVEPPVEMRAVASVRLSNSFEPRLATAATVSTRLSDSRRFAWRIPCRRASHGDVMSRWLSLPDVLSSSLRGLRLQGAK